MVGDGYCPLLLFSSLPMCGTRPTPTQSMWLFWVPHNDQLHLYTSRQVCPGHCNTATNTLERVHACVAGAALPAGGRGGGQPAQWRIRGRIHPR